MAVVSRVATLRIDDAATHANFREWVATAVTQDTAAGGSVDVTVVQTSGGATPPGVANTLELRMYNDSGTLVRTYNLVEASASQTVTFFFTDTGDTGGAARCGTVEIAVYAQRTDLATYEVETDGSPNTPGAGNHSHTLDRGWIRGTTTLVEAISNVALGGAKTLPGAYDDSLFVRTTSGHVSYVARALTVTLSAGSVSGATNSTTAAQRDVTFSAVCDNRFPAASTTVTISVTVPNAALTGAPDWTYTTTTDDSIAVDPRLTVTHLLQLNDNVFGTPPLSKDAVDHDRLTADLGLAASRITNARAEGRNGVTLTESLQDINGLVVALSRTGQVATAQGGQDGWSPTLQTWDSQLPGGGWNHTVTVTAPADATGASYLLTPVDATFTLLAINPNVSIHIGFALPSASNGRHAQAGDILTIVCGIENVATGKRLLADTGTVECSVIRYDPATGNLQYYDGATWQNWPSTTALTRFAMTHVGDGVYTRAFTTTEWGEIDILAAQVILEIDGTPYKIHGPREMTAADNRHDGYALDALGLALSGVLSQK